MEPAWLPMPWTALAHAELRMLQLPSCLASHCPAAAWLFTCGPAALLHCPASTRVLRTLPPTALNRRPERSRQTPPCRDGWASAWVTCRGAGGQHRAAFSGEVSAVQTLMGVGRHVGVWQGARKTGNSCRCKLPVAGAGAMQAGVIMFFPVYPVAGAGAMQSVVIMFCPALFTCASRIRPAWCRPRGRQTQRPPPGTISNSLG